MTAHVRRWTNAVLFGASVLTAGTASAGWTPHKDLEGCVAYAEKAAERTTYCSGLLPASRQARCTDEVTDSAGDWNNWCAAEWTARQLPEEENRSSLYPTDTNLGKCERPSSPIVIDVRGDGFALTDAVHGVGFDLYRIGHPQQLGWTARGSDDAWLALDRNANGVIDDGGELFGNYTDQPVSSEPNGFTALAVFDEPSEGGNPDSQIDENDAVFARLLLWQDRNHDGVSQPDELIDLPTAGVRALSLSYSVSSVVDRYGNAFRYVAPVEPQRGAPLGPRAYDVFLVSLWSSSPPVGGPVATAHYEYACYKTCYAVTQIGLHCSPYEHVAWTQSTVSLDHAKSNAASNCGYHAMMAINNTGTAGGCAARILADNNGVLYQDGPFDCNTIFVPDPDPGPDSGPQGGCF